MIKLLGLLAAALLPLAPLAARQAAPDPAALDLARLLMSRDETLYDDADLGRFEQQIAEQLLASNACDQRSTECVNLAASVARQFAPDYRQGERARLELITAHLIADGLQPGEAARMAQYLRSAEGGRLLDMLAMLRQPGRTEERRREIARSLDRGQARASAAALARFRQRARLLPPPRPS